MKILQLTLRMPWPLHDGGAIAMHQVTKQLHAAGHYMVLATLNTRKHYQPPEVLANIAEVYTVDIDTTPRGWAAIRSWLTGGIPYNIRRFRSSAFSRLLEALLDRHHFDVIQLEGVYLAMYVPDLRLGSRAPIVLRAHNVEYEIWQRLYHETTLGPRKWYFGHLARAGKRFEAQHLPRFDGIAAIAPDDAAQFRQLGYTGPIEVIPACVALPDTPEAMPQPEPNSIGFLGSLEWLPNVEGLRWFLREVWPHLQPEGLEFHIAGRNPGPEVRSWQQQGVTVVGEVPDAAAFLMRFPVVVVPLFSGSGLRIKILEAMAWRRCVVTTSVGAQGLTCTPGTHLLVADQPAAFAEAVRSLLQSPDRRQEMQENAVSLLADHYDCRTFARRLTAFYQSLG